MLGSDSGDFEQNLRALNADLANRFQGIRIALLSQNNPMGVQQAASSARSAMEIISRLLPVGEVSVGDFEEYEIDQHLDDLEQIANGGPHVELFSAAEKINAVLPKIRRALDKNKPSKRQLARAVLSTVDPRFDVLPIGQQQDLAKEWGLHWENMSRAIHSNHTPFATEEVLACASFLEGLLRRYLQPNVIEAIAQIDDILSRFDGSNASSLFREASPLLKNGVLLEYFLNQLSSPAWIVPLSENHHFQAASNAQSDQVGMQRQLYAPLKYIARISKGSPEQCFPVLMSLDVSPSELIKGLIVESACNLLDNQLPAISKKLVDWNVRTSPHISVEQMTGMVSRLQTSGSETEAYDFALGLLGFPERNVATYDLVTPFSEWEYEKFCIELVSVFPDALTLVDLFATVLDEALTLSSRLSMKDSSHFWMPVFDVAGGDRFSKSIKSSLGQLVIDQALVSLARQNMDIEPILDISRKQTSEFFRRFEFFVMGFASQETYPKYWQSLFESAALVPSGQFSDLWIMAGRLCKVATQHDKQQLVDMFARLAVTSDVEPSMLVRALSILCEYDGATFESILGKVCELTGFARINRPRRGIEFSGWAGEISPIKAADISALGADAFLDYIDGWTPDNSFPQPSLYTIAQELKLVLSEETKFLDQSLIRLVEYPEFVGTYLTSRESLLKVASKDELDSWLTLIESSASTSQELASPSMHFLTALIDSKVFLDASDIVLKELRIISLLVRRLEAGEFEVEPETTAVQIYQRAINDSFSMAIAGAISAFSIESIDPQVLEAQEDLRELVLNRLERPQAAILLPSCIIGVKFSWLAYKFPEWTRKLEKQLRYSKRGSIADALIACHFIWGQPTMQVLAEHRWIYDRALTRRTNTIQDQLANEAASLASKLLCVFFVWGQIKSSNDFLQSLGKVLGRVRLEELIQDFGRDLSRRDKIEPVAGGRAQELWEILEAQTAQLDQNVLPDLANAFAEWFSASCLSATWRLETFNRLLETRKFEIRDLYTTCEVIRSLSEDWALECLTIANTLVMGSVRKIDLFWASDHLFDMLDRIDESSGEEVHKAAQSLRGQLARAGVLRAK
jgi:hypothetical protein